MREDPPPKPEEHELEKKLQELTALETQLAERETELATLQNAIHSFERKSRSVLDGRYVILAQIRTKISELIARQAADVEIGEAAPQSASFKLPPPPPRNPSAARAARKYSTALTVPRESVAERLKQLYRDVAKAIHPDLANDDSERAQRHQLMSRANEAYEANDAKTLESILHDWQAAPEAIRGRGTIPELIRAIRKIHRCQRRLAEIDVEVNRITGSGLYGLKTMAEAADSYERNLLDEMAARLDDDIAAAEQQLAALEKETGGNSQEPGASPAAPGPNESTAA